MSDVWPDNVRGIAWGESEWACLWWWDLDPLNDRED